MAHIRIHARPLTSASRAARRLRYIEAMCERHWPFAAYTLLTLAAIGYVVAQIAPLV